MESPARPLAARAAPARPEWELPAKYQPLRVLGAGGMGTVLLARDRNLGRLLAVKVLRTECPVFLERLQREARLLARLEHPAIVRVHDLDVFGGKTYLAMEYVPGGNLALARPEPELLVRTLRGVVDALGHAHAQGIVHRDVKPENVLLHDRRGLTGSEDEGRAVLTDFGLAVDRERVSQGPRPIAGTPLTMSPEQVGGEPVGPASDVFSLGVTLYRQLTATWPFRGRTVGDVLDAIRNCEAPPMAPSVGSSVPRRLEEIVRRCLEKRPDARFASMEELGAALDRFLRPRALFALPWSRSRGRRASPVGPDIHPEELS